MAQTAESKGRFRPLLGFEMIIPLSSMLKNIQIFDFRPK